ncbi:MAG: heterocyst frequency control protein PatD [Microcystaceae cyanobacterium]
MLPTSWQNHYQLLLENCQSLQNLLNSEKIEINQLKRCFGEFKDQFYSFIVPLKADNLNLNSIGQWQSRQTELYRMMRLVETEMLFLQSSRQGETRQSRLRQISDRLQTMTRFCLEILQLQ